MMDAYTRAEQKLRIDRLILSAPMGSVWRKTSGSEWSGKVVGYYSTTLTSEGLCIESDKHPGSVQIYPMKALERIDQ
jgi:hypothetical protein